MNRAELLAPAGSFDALRAAISAGCDAVYIGGAKFGARAYANNFNHEEIKKAIKLAHLYGVRVYVTINTLLYDQELKEALDYIYELYIHDVDAIIIQDLGLLRLANRYFPDLELHASTQMSIHNLEGVKFLEKYGISRVVLARENSIEEIKQINRETPLELEVFIHGALCVSYSGQCLMSGLIGGRSGNRGRCAQPCRKLYKTNNCNETDESEQYYLSTKDLNTIEHISELLDAGVHSLKIEGRMKKPEYVYTVVKAYREVIDSYYKNKQVTVSRKDYNKIAQMFNRTFTTGFLFNEESDHLINLEKNNNQGIKIGTVIAYKDKKALIELKDSLSVGDGVFFNHDQIGTQISKIMMGKEKVEKAEVGSKVTVDVPHRVKTNGSVYKTLDINLMKDARTNIEQMNRKVKIVGTAMFKIGNRPTLKVSDELGNVVENSIEFKVEVSKGQPVSHDQLEMQLNKLGNTPYTFETLIVNADQGIFIPKSIINKLRRQAIDDLSRQRENRYKREYIKKPIFSYLEIKPNIEQSEVPEIAVYVRTSAQLEAVIKKGIDAIYINKGLSNCDNYSVTDQSYIATKRIEHNSNYIKQDYNYLFSQIGDLYKGSKLNDITTVSNYSLNVTNSEAIDFLTESGINYITLSHELNEDHYKHLLRSNKSNIEVIVYGHQEAMITKYTHRTASNNENTVSYLIDQKNESFPVYLDEDNNTHILNSKKLLMLDELDDLLKLGYKRFRLEFTIENYNETEKILEAYKEYIYNKNKNKLQKLVKHYKNKRQYTRGYYTKNSI